MVMRAGRRSPGRLVGRLLVGALVCGMALVAGCRGPSQPYTSLGAHAFPLRGQFNRDAGHTRIVLLPAPT